MSKKKKRLLILGILFTLSVIAVAIGWRYFPFNKVMKVSSSEEKEFTNPQQIRAQAPNTLYFDFEVLAGKETPGGFFKGLAHSGQYSVKAFGQNSYSVAIERKAGEVGLQNLKAVAISAWVYVKPTKNDVTAALVFAVSNELGVNVTWQAVALREPLVPREKWFKISGYFDLASITFKPDYKIQVYFWNNSRTDILVDDYFISFGGPVDRRGDSARVDLTRGTGFTPKFNYPPFPVTFLEKQNDGKMIPPAEIGQNDKMVSGSFLPGGGEEILVMKGNSKAYLWSWCADLKEFRKLALTVPQQLAGVGKITRIMKGKFITGEEDQFIIGGEKGYMLGVIDPAGDPCKEASASRPAIRILSKSETPMQLLAAGDFNGDRIDELLVVRDNGSWRLFRFQAATAGGDWKIVAEDDQPVKEWVKGNYETGLSAGKFRPGSTDQLLAVSKDKAGKSNWTLLRFNGGKLRWEPVYPATRGASANNSPANSASSGSGLYTGHTIGPDTLKPTDIFFASCILHPASCISLHPASLLRYSRSWRFDLKEILFNDSTYQVLQNIDFTGFEASHNPKYYESLLLVPGNFTGGGGFFVSGRIAKERNYGPILPDFNDIYVFPKTASK